MDTHSLDLRAFARVARLGSFAGAARELRLSTTAVSRRVSNLEDRLGARLLHRTTRQVSLTPAGTATLERAEQVLADLEELADVASGGDTPRGHIRVTAGVSLGHAMLHDAMPPFLQAHPDVSVELVLADRAFDLVTERIDLAIRIGTLPDSTLIARRLGTVRHVLCASPSWVAHQGPLTAEGLERCDRIVDTNQSRMWRLDGPKGQLEVPALGRYAANSAHAALDACRAALGVAMLPDFVARPALAAGEIVDVLPAWRGPEVGLFAVVLERRWMSAAVRALVEHMRAMVSATA